MSTAYRTDTRDAIAASSVHWEDSARCSTEQIDADLELLRPLFTADSVTSLRRSIMQVRRVRIECGEQMGAFAILCDHARVMSVAMASVVDISNATLDQINAIRDVSVLYAYVDLTMVGASIAEGCWTSSMVRVQDRAREIIAERDAWLLHTIIDAQACANTPEQFADLDELLHTEIINLTKDES